MSYDNLSSVSTQVIVRHRICLQTDGHGETSKPPYNFVAGGITIQQQNLQKGSVIIFNK
jgi:hypothetical protein